MKLPEKVEFGKDTYFRVGERIIRTNILDVVITKFKWKGQDEDEARKWHVKLYWETHEWIGTRETGGRQIRIEHWASVKPQGATCVTAKQKCASCLPS